MPTRAMAALFPSVPSRKAKIGTSIAALTLQLILGTLAAPVALPGCPEACGNVAVPYPFGFRHGCFHEGFNLTCDEMSQPPKLFVGDRSEVVSMSLTDGTMRINTKVLYIPLNVTSLHLNSSWPAGLTAGGPLKVSSRHNRFVAVGCNILASLIPHSNHQVSICAAYCADDLMVSDTDRSCSGLACCQTPIARPDLPSYDVQLSNLTQRSARLPRYGAVFMADQEWLSGGVNVSWIYSNPLQPKIEVLTVLEWSLHMHRDKNMYLASNYPDSYQRKTCASVNSMVVDDDNDENYGRCSCLRGYEGNPYMANGCQGKYYTCYLAFSTF